MIDCVVGHHLNPYRSGVARFNDILAVRLGVPLLSLWDGWGERDCPLLSFKPEELEPDEAQRLGELLDSLGDTRFRIFLHDFSGGELEERFVQGAELVYCGNAEVLSRVEPLNPSVELLWSPSTIADCRPFSPAEVSVFSFGMAHKLRVDEFERLRELLDSLGSSYALYISNANHETTRLEDTQVLFEQMQQVFPKGLYFLGHLSDVAVFNHLVGATFFAAFFRKGVRANNSTVVSAMEHGAVVITNLDQHSPEYLVHMENVIDVNRATELPTDPLVLRRISVAAMETARGLGWDSLAARIKDPLRASPQRGLGGREAGSPRGL